MAYLYYVIQEDAGRSQGPWTPLPVPVSVGFLVIRAIVFSISAILTFKVLTSDSSYALGSLYFFRLTFNYWVSIYVACFTFYVLVCPVAVETQRDSSPGDYTLPPVIESSSPRSEILSPYEQRARYSPPSRES